MSRFVNTEKILAELGEAASKAAKEALAQGAEALVQCARDKVPVKSGALKESIHAIKQKAGAVYRIVAGAENKDGIPYGRYVEFSPKIARPFMYPAMDEKREAIKKMLVDAVRQAVRRKQ